MLAPETKTQPATIRGRYGSTRFAVLTITDPEFDSAQAILRLNHQITGSPYYVESPSGTHDYAVVLRQSAERTNHPASKAVGWFIEHFRPEYMLVVGTAGGVVGNEVAVGDIFIPNYVEYCEPAKLTEGRNLTRKYPSTTPRYAS